MIFVGTVTAVESRWVDDTHQSVETMVTFDDLSWLKGEPQRSVTLRFAGGTLEGLRVERDGKPQIFCSEWCIRWSELRDSGQDYFRLPIVPPKLKTTR